MIRSTILRLLCFVPLTVFVGCATHSSTVSHGGDRSLVDVQRWARQQGGILQDGRSARACDALAKLVLGASHTSLTVSVLDCDRPAAYAWPSGQLFVSRGLMDLLSDEELTAAIAHEVGHLNVETPPHSQMALEGRASHSEACEIAADAAGLRLLRQAGLPTVSMGAMLRKVAASPLTSESARRLLTERASHAGHE